MTLHRLQLAYSAGRSFQTSVWWLFSTGMSFTVQSIKNRAKKSIIIFVSEHILYLRDLNLYVEICFKRSDRIWFGKQHPLPQLNLKIIKITICIWSARTKYSFKWSLAKLLHPCQIQRETFIQTFLGKHPETQSIDQDYLDDWRHVCTRQEDTNMQNRESRKQPIPSENAISTCPYLIL